MGEKWLDSETLQDDDSAAPESGTRCFSTEIDLHSDRNAPASDAMSELIPFESARRAMVDYQIRGGGGPPAKVGGGRLQINPPAKDGGAGR